jgi:hypothetical protein
MPADPLSLGDPDGYGRYGVLEEQPGGLVCHECRRTFPSLGLHAYRGHGMTAAQYRERHGLQRTAGLITAELRTRIQDNARAQIASTLGSSAPRGATRACDQARPVTAHVCDSSLEISCLLVMCSLWRS